MANIPTDLPRPCNASLVLHYWQPVVFWNHVGEVLSAAGQHLFHGLYLQAEAEAAQRRAGFGWYCFDDKRVNNGNWDWHVVGFHDGRVFDSVFGSGQQRCANRAERGEPVLSGADCSFRNFYNL